MIRLFQFRQTFWIWLFIGLIILFGVEILPYPPAVGMRLVLWFIASIVLFILDGDQYKEHMASIQNQAAAAGSKPFDVNVIPAAVPNPPPSYEDVMAGTSPSTPQPSGIVKGEVYKP